MVWCGVVWCGLFDFFFLIKRIVFVAWSFHVSSLIVYVVGVCVEREIMEWVRVIEKERMGFYCISISISIEE